MEDPRIGAVLRTAGPDDLRPHFDTAYHLMLVACDVANEGLLSSLEHTSALPDPFWDTAFDLLCDGKPPGELALALDSLILEEIAEGASPARVAGCVLIRRAALALDQGSDPAGIEALCESFFALLPQDEVAYKLADAALEPDGSWACLLSQESLDNLLKPL